MKRLYWLLILVLAFNLVGIATAQEPVTETEEEFPSLYIDLTGKIAEIDEESGAIIINGITIQLDFTNLPEGIEIIPGATVTISGELLEDGTIVADIVIEVAPAADEEDTSEDGSEGEDNESEDGESEDDGEESEDEESEGEEEAGSSCGFTDGEGETAEGDGESEEGGRCHPVLEILSNEFEVPYEELQDLRDENYGIGEIARAYLLAEAAGVDVNEITELRDSGMGWGQIMKEYPDVHPSDLAPGSVIGNGRGHSARNDEGSDSETFSSTSGNGNNGNGNGGGNGNGSNGNGNGNGGGNGNGNNGNGNGNGGGNGNGNNGNGNGNGGGNGRK